MSWFSKSWRRQRRHFSAVALLPIMTLAYVLASASLTIAFVVGSEFPSGSQPQGEWVSVFAATDDPRSDEISLELLSEQQLAPLMTASAANFIKASHFTRTLRHEVAQFETEVAFVNQAFFTTLGLPAPVQQLADNDIIIASKLARRQQIVAGDVVSIGDQDFRVAGVIDSFRGLTGNTDVYIAESHLVDVIYGQVPKKIRTWVTSQLPLYFFAMQVDDHFTPAALSLDPQAAIRYQFLDGIQIAPEQAAYFARINNAILYAAGFLLLIFAATDSALTSHWLRQRYGELALMSTVGATRHQLLSWLLKIWLLPRLLMVLAVVALTPLGITQLLQLLGYTSVAVDYGLMGKAVGLLLILFSVVVLLILYRVRRHLREVVTGLRSLRASTRRLPVKRYLQAAGASLLLLMIVTSALVTTVIRVQQAVNQPLYLNQAKLFTVSLTLDEGYEVDMSTLRRRSQAVDVLLTHFAAFGTNATASNVLPMREPNYKEDLSTVAGHTLAVPQQIAVANVAADYQTVAQHVLAFGAWPRAHNEIAVNEAFLRRFGLSDNTLPEIWLQDTRHQVTAIVKDSYWLNPLATPTPIVWRPTGTPSSDLLVEWSGTTAQLEQEVRRQLTAVENGITVDAIKSIEQARDERMRSLVLLLQMLGIVALTTVAITVGALWVAINSWLMVKKWPLTVYRAVGATKYHLRQELWQQVAWPFVAFIPLGFAGALYAASQVNPALSLLNAFYLSAGSVLVVGVTLVTLLWRAYQQLLGLDAAELTKDIT